MNEFFEKSTKLLNIFHKFRSKSFQKNSSFFQHKPKFYFSLIFANFEKDTSFIIVYVLNFCQNFRENNDFIRNF